MNKKSVPINFSLRRGLQTLAAGTAMATVMFGGFFGAYLLVYLILYTRYWPVAILYLIWAYVIDKDSCEHGGRRIEWIRDWTWWKYFGGYFPFRLERLPGVELDPKRNYLFCCFPHGVLPVGSSLAFGTNCGGFHKLFPRHTPYSIILKQLFDFPVLRELFLALGGASASKTSLNWILGSPEGGKVAALAVGGAVESFYCKPRQHRIVLKNRKGFVKLALENGSPLVPVYSFGETDIFDQVNSPEGSVLRRIQNWVKDRTGFVPIIPLGRGFFKYSLGVVPFRKPLSTVVGKPIEVHKVAQPTQEQINTLHQEFTKQLTKLFEEQKYNYLPYAQEAKLVIE